VSFVAPVAPSAIPESRYVVFSEAAAVASEARATGLRRDAFAGSSAVAPDVTTKFGPDDATHSIEITPAPVDFGWGLLIHGDGVADNFANLSGYAATGTLNFWISTLYPGKIEIGIATDNPDRVGQEAFLQLQPGNFGYCNTGAWCQVSIPVQKFLAVNPALDLSLVTSRFVIADRYGITGNAHGSTAKLYVDGIYWDK
jgi:hypothetical protein